MATLRHQQNGLPTPSKPALGSVAIVGAGISGLAAGYCLKVEGVKVTMFEAENRSGGKIQSVSENGIIWEKGPNTMMETGPEVGKVIDELQLREKQQFPVMQSRRYIVRSGKAELLPSNPLAFLGSKLLSAQAKIRILCEPFLWKRKKSDMASLLPKDESVGDFFERHVGREVVDYMVDPFVAGTSGSDPDSLSMRHAFPDVWMLEERYGSILVGAIKSAFDKRKKKETLKHDDSGIAEVKSRKPLRGSFSFLGGLQTLTDALADRIGEENIKYNSSVLSLACNQQGNPLRDSWKVSFLSESGKRGKQSELHFDAVIMTAPLGNFQEMQVSKDARPYSLQFIPKVIYQPLSVLVMAFKKEDVKHPLKGFGVLVPSKEQANGFQTLGTLFSSSMFPDRAPSDSMVFTTFIGGSRNRSFASSSTMILQEAAMADLHQLVGVVGKPIFTKHIFWSKAFPQYSLGYDEVLNALKRLETDLPGFYYVGNHRDGLSVGKALESGYNMAGQVVEYLQCSGGRKLYTMASSDL